MADSFDARIDAHWSAQLGCAPAALHTPGLTVLPHSTARRGWNGVYAIRNGEAAVVAVPEPLLDRARHKLRGMPADEAVTTFTLNRIFGAIAERFVGPAWIGYADAASFRPAPAADTDEVRQLGDGDSDDVVRLSEACDETEWEHSGIDPRRRPIFALYRGPEIAAATSWEALSNGLLHVGVIAHPAHRQRGYGRAVASAITAHGISQGAVMQWQTLADNAPSLAIGKSLGYRHRYRTVAVRLRETEVP